MQLRLIFEPSENFRSFFIAGAIPGMALRQCVAIFYTPLHCVSNGGRRNRRPAGRRVW